MAGTEAPTTRTRWSAFKPPFDIIHRMAKETIKAADAMPTACPMLLPLLNEL
jgi:hypothetical protein